MFLPGESQGQGNLVGCRLWDLTESNTTEATKQQARTWKCSWTKYNQLNKDNSLQLGDQQNRSNYTLEFGEGNGTPLQYSCLENPMDGGAWKAAVHWVAKSWTWLSDFPFTFHFHALEKEMATHSSVLAWRIPGTEEPGGLPSMGSQRVGHDWSDLAAAAAAYPWISLFGITI